MDNIEERVRSRNCNGIIIFIYDIILMKLLEDDRLIINKGNKYKIVVTDMNDLFRLNGKFISYDFYFKGVAFTLVSTFEKDEDPNTYNKVDNENIYFKLKEKEI